MGPSRDNRSSYDERLFPRLCSDLLPPAQSEYRQANHFIRPREAPARRDQDLELEIRLPSLLLWKLRGSKKSVSRIEPGRKERPQSVGDLRQPSPLRNQLRRPAKPDRDSERGLLLSRFQGAGRRERQIRARD